MRLAKFAAVAASTAVVAMVLAGPASAENPVTPASAESSVTPDKDGPNAAHYPEPKHQHHSSVEHGPGPQSKVEKTPKDSSDVK
jgi:hypothetical protein